MSQNNGAVDLEFVNRLVRVYYEGWKSTTLFRDLIKKEIFIAANKDRPDVISEIELLSFNLYG